MSNNPPLIQLSPNVVNNNGEDQQDDPCISSVAASGSVLAATKLCGEVALFETEKLLSDNNNNSNNNDSSTSTSTSPFMTFRAHQDSLNCCKFLSSKVGNGTFLATGSDDSTVRIFDCKNINDNNRGYPIAVYPAPSEVNCLCESTDGTMLYAGCDDGSIVTYTFGGFADATSLNNNNNNSNNNNNTPFPQAAPPARTDRFMVGEGAVNDIIIINLPYGDVLFTATDDGCVRAWRTQPGQRAPNEPVVALPSNDEMNQQINEAANEQDQENNNQNGGDREDSSSAESDAAKLREIITRQLGDESANRLITSFDMLQGGQILHIIDSTIGNDPAILVAATNYVFAVPFNISTGQLADEPALLFNGNEDFIRGILPVGGKNNNNSSSSSNFYTVCDDGSVAMFNRNLQNQQEPVGPMKKFQAESHGLNIMSSVMMKNESVLVTGSLFGSVKLWKM